MFMWILCLRIIICGLPWTALVAISLAWLDTALIKSCRHFSTFLSNFSQSWSQKPQKFILTSHNLDSRNPKIDFFSHIFWGKNTNPKIPSDQKNPEPYQQQVNDIATFFVTIKFTQYSLVKSGWFKKKPPSSLTPFWDCGDRGIFCFFSFQVSASRGAAVLLAQKFLFIAFTVFQT